METTNENTTNETETVLPFGVDVERLRPIERMGFGQALARVADLDAIIAAEDAGAIAAIRDALAEARTAANHAQAEVLRQEAALLAERKDAERAEKDAIVAEFAALASRKIPRVRGNGNGVHRTPSTNNDGNPRAGGFSRAPNGTRQVNGRLFDVMTNMDVTDSPSFAAWRTANAVRAVA